MGSLRVSVEQRAWIEAVSARVHLSVSGSSAVTGTAAVKKAAEVRDVVAALTQVGLTEADIDVVGLNAETSAGLLTKAQKVHIRLRVNVALGQLPAVLGQLTNRPGVRVTSLEWVYAEFEASIQTAAAGLGKARQKAEALAAAAGQRIIGIAEISDSWVRASDADRPRGFALSAGPAKAAPDFDLGTDFTGSTELIVRVNVEYQISD